MSPGPIPTPGAPVSRPPFCHQPHGPQWVSWAALFPPPHPPAAPLCRLLGLWKGIKHGVLGALACTVVARADPEDGIGISVVVGRTMVVSEDKILEDVAMPLRKKPLDFWPSTNSPYTGLCSRLFQIFDSLIICVFLQPTMSRIHSFQLFSHWLSVCMCLMSHEWECDRVKGFPRSHTVCHPGQPGPKTLYKNPEGLADAALRLLGAGQWLTQARRPFCIHHAAGVLTRPLGPIGSVFYL